MEVDRGCALLKRHDSCHDDTSGHLQSVAMHDRSARDMTVQESHGSVLWPQAETAAFVRRAMRSLRNATRVIQQ
jgi:hypothetical protein